MVGLGELVAIVVMIAAVFSAFAYFITRALRAGRNMLGGNSTPRTSMVGCGARGRYGADRRLSRSRTRS